MAKQPQRRRPTARPDQARTTDSESNLLRAMRAQEETMEPDDTREADSVDEDREDARSSRDQELRDYQTFYEGEDFDVSWLESANLVAPAPRQGMVQRWIATRVMGQDIPARATAQWRKGWRPRDPSTVKNASFPNFKDADGTGYIGYAGLILMERPIHVARKAREMNRSKIREQHAAIEGDLRAEEVPGQPFSIEHRSVVTTRPVAVDEDF